METNLGTLSSIDLPFDLLLLPTWFPPLVELKLWVYPADDQQEAPSDAS